MWNEALIVLSYFSGYQEWFQWEKLPFGMIIQLKVCLNLCYGIDFQNTISACKEIIGDSSYTSIVVSH